MPLCKTKSVSIEETMQMFQTKQLVLIISEFERKCLQNIQSQTCCKTLHKGTNYSLLQLVLIVEGDVYNQVVRHQKVIRSPKSLKVGALKQGQVQNQVKFVGQAFLTVANNEFDLGAATTDAQFPASQFLRSMAQLPAHLQMPMGL